MSFQAYVDHVEAKTGRSIGELVTMARTKGLADEAGLAPGVKAAKVIGWLKADFGLGHGHAMSVVAYIKGKRE